VIVCENITVARDDHAGSQRALPLLRRHVRTLPLAALGLRRQLELVAEEPAEELIRILAVLKVRRRDFGVRA
jgi:hypothetical protein